MEIFSLKIGVDSTTGLPYGVFDWTFFTDWDLGVYIQAVMEAQKIGLINKGQAIDRLAYILTFLENRTLNSYGYPFWFYDARTEQRSTVFR